MSRCSYFCCTDDPLVLCRPDCVATRVGYRHSAESLEPLEHVVRLPAHTGRRMHDGELASAFVQYARQPVTDEQRTPRLDVEAVV